MITEEHLQQKHIFYKKIAVSVMAAVFLVLLYMIIFAFSGQDGETSGSISGRIAEKCVEQLSYLSGEEWTEQKRHTLVEDLEQFIRKLAHFMEYACMAVLVYGIWRPWKPRNMRLYLLVIIWVIFSAAGDEIHQLFVPDRYGNVVDVLLDTCGGMFGLWCCVTMEKIFCCRKGRLKWRK